MPCISLKSIVGRGEGGFPPNSVKNGPKTVFLGWKCCFLGEKHSFWEFVNCATLTIYIISFCSLNDIIIKNTSNCNAIVHWASKAFNNLSPLIHMTSSSNADACYSLNGKLPDDPQWGRWEWGNNHLYHRCLQLARYDWSTILCGGRALLPDFCTVAHMWAPSSFSSYFFNIFFHS